MEPEGDYHIHKCPPPIPFLSQLDPVPTSTSHFLKIHLNIILLSKPGSPKWSLSPRFPHQHSVYTSPLPLTRYMPRPPHSSRFDHPKIFGEEYRSLSSSLCSFLHSFPTSSLLGPNSPQHPILKHPQPTFLPQYERPSFTPVQNNKQSYSSV